MIQHCCDANQFFDAKEAAAKARAFRRKGARGASRRLLKMMQPAVKAGDSLLDIGGGVGALGLELKGLQQYTAVDASLAYLSEAQKLFTEHQWTAEQLRFEGADFTEVAAATKAHHHVCLDKVICCYPNMEELLSKACEKAEKQVGLVYPLTGLIPSLFQAVGNFYFKIKKSAFRGYLHPRQKVAALLESHGFRCTASSWGIPWRVEVWRRQ